VTLMTSMMLMTLVTLVTLVTSAMPISLRLYYQHNSDKNSRREAKMRNGFLAPAGTHLSELSNKSTRDEQSKMMTFGRRELSYLKISAFCLQGR
jgi:hypothetical protein